MELNYIRSRSAIAIRSDIKHDIVFFIIHGIYDVRIWGYDYNFTLKLYLK